MPLLLTSMGLACVFTGMDFDTSRVRVRSVAGAQGEEPGRPDTVTDGTAPCEAGMIRFEIRTVAPALRRVVLVAANTGYRPCRLPGTHPTVRFAEAGEVAGSAGVQGEEVVLAPSQRAFAGIAFPTVVSPARAGQVTTVLVALTRDDEPQSVPVRPGLAVRSAKVTGWFAASW
ncbi:DUF4232 domain-containing protein [Streptomyces sp. NPDC015492]|uniref:DUF4232 domain-containing protein n=1 Tax=Streptomyces sp. NPDC015492 TaxID=3364958 RepID=UPI0037014BCA